MSREKSNLPANLLSQVDLWTVPIQVFMLDTQCSPKTPNTFDHAQSCQLIIELPPDEKPNGHTKKR